MIISSALPVKLWVNSTEVYNQKDEPGVDLRRWLQPWQPDDNIIVQLQDDYRLILQLQIIDINQVVIQTIDFTVEQVNSSYVFTCAFNFRDYGITDEVVSIVVTSLQSEIVGTLTPPMGIVAGTMQYHGQLFEAAVELSAPMAVMGGTVLNQKYPNVQIQNYAVSDIDITDIDIVGAVFTPHHGSFPMDTGDQMAGNSDTVGIFSYQVAVTVTTLSTPHYISVADSNGTIKYANVSGSFTYTFTNIVTNNLGTILIQLRQGSI